MNTTVSTTLEKLPAKDILVDGFARPINYARISVTDRCDFRCVYCMAEEMTFLPRQHILSLEEIVHIARALVSIGINRLRLTGGEPLVRQNIVWLAEQLNQITGIEEISLTTNGSQLARLAKPLHDAGISRINVSLDSLNPNKFKQLTRTGDLAQVLEGIAAAQSVGFKKIKLNSVILKGRNDDEILPLVHYAVDNALDIAFIEEMPLGAIVEHDRELAFCSSNEVKQIIEREFKLEHSDKKTNGPSRYVKVVNEDTHIGFISPHSNNFCSSCNRIRITAEGRLLLCLGNEDSVDLKALVRDERADEQQLASTMREALQLKPEKHHFDLSEQTDIVRFMNMTGG